MGKLQKTRQVWCLKLSSELDSRALWNNAQSLGLGGTACSLHVQKVDRLDEKGVGVWFGQRRGCFRVIRQPKSTPGRSNLFLAEARKSLPCF